MRIKETLKNRLTLLGSVLVRTPAVRRVGFWDGLFCSVKSFGQARREIQKTFIVTAIDNHLSWVVLPPYGLAWPSASPVSKLAGVMTELWCRTSSHYYFTPSTRVKPGDVGVDVGACEGAFALECLLRYQAAEVYCFEPSPLMAAALAITAQRNSLEGRMHVVAAAASNASGSVPFYESPSDPLSAFALGEPRPSAESRTAVTVAQMTLDDWARSAGIQKLDYLKIDAEGYDLAVLEGARGCLERWRPTVVVTTYHRTDHCEQILSYLTSLDLGYRFKVKGLVVFDANPRPVLLHATVAG